jgi:hypothetical protein
MWSWLLRACARAVRGRKRQREHGEGEDRERKGKKEEKRDEERTLTDRSLSGTSLSDEKYRLVALNRRGDEEVEAAHS